LTLFDNPKSQKERTALTCVLPMLKT